MKFKAPLIFLILLFFSLFTNAQDHGIIVGTGGGFSGAVTAYKITLKGEVFKGNGIAEIKYTECAGIKKSKAKKLIQQATSQVTAIKDFNQPGNIYSFIELEKDGKRITWGNNNTPAPEQIKALYTDMMNTVSTLKYKPIKK